MEQDAGGLRRGVNGSDGGTSVVMILRCGLAVFLGRAGWPGRLLLGGRGRRRSGMSRCEAC